MSTPTKRRRVYHPGKSPFASPKAVVQQHFKGETDINNIVEKARRGIAPGNIREHGHFADFSNAPQNLDEAFKRVEDALDSFEQLPAKAREELGNDPRRLMQVNAEFLVRHGLAKPRTKSPEATQGSPGGSGEGSPAKPSKKASKAAPAANSDQDDQD